MSNVSKMLFGMLWTVDNWTARTFFHHFQSENATFDMRFAVPGSEKARNCETFGMQKRDV